MIKQGRSGCSDAAFVNEENPASSVWVSKGLPPAAQTRAAGPPDER